MAFSLYNRLTEQGTISEPVGIPDPRFALPSTINWMHALAMLTNDKGINFTSALRFYHSINQKKLSDHQENTVFEQLLFGLHQLSALEALTSITRRADVARIGIVAWYYGIYHAASAMVAAQDGTLQETHATTAKTWDNQFSMRGLVMEPFSLRVSSLVQSVFTAEIDALRLAMHFH